MEKSIESIWKEGFLKSDALVAPKLNDLYNQKSKTIIDRLKRMMKMNNYFIVVLACINLGVYAAMGTPVAGACIFCALLAVYWLSVQQQKTMENIDAHRNSYDYLKSFDSWLKKSIANQSKVMRFFYPLVFLAALMPIVHALKTGEITHEAMLDSGYHLIYGIPTVAWMIAFAIAVLIYIFGGKIYRWDVNVVYGRIFRKLEDMLVEMEKLRN